MLNTGQSRLTNDLNILLQLGVIIIPNMMSQVRGRVKRLFVCFWTATAITEQVTVVSGQGGCVHEGGRGGTKNRSINARLVVGLTLCSQNNWVPPR